MRVRTPIRGRFWVQRQPTLLANGYTTEVLLFSGLSLPTNTLTYIVGLPGNTGSYDDSFVNWQQFTAVAGAPTVGSSNGVMWYGTSPGNFVPDTSYAQATGAKSNLLAAQFNTTVPEPGAATVLVTMLAGLGGLIVALRKKLA